MKKIVSSKIILGIIILLSAFLRFWQLGSIPVGVTHDEMGYIYMSPLDDLKATESAYFTQPVFENPKVKILKTLREEMLEYLKGGSLQFQ